MRRIALSTLVLLVPALAHAQARPAATQTVQTATLEAKSTPPARPATAVAATAAGKADTAAPKFYDTLETKIDESVAALATRDGGSLTFVMYGSDNDTPTAPKLLHTVNRVLPLQTLADKKSDGNVVLHMDVDPSGTPRYITVVRSAGAVIDARTIAAAEQFRFTPATENHMPINSAVTIEFKLHEK